MRHNVAFGTVHIIIWGHIDHATILCINVLEERSNQRGSSPQRKTMRPRFLTWMAVSPAPWTSTGARAPAPAPARPRPAPGAVPPRTPPSRRLLPCRGPKTAAPARTAPTGADPGSTRRPACRTPFAGQSRVPCTAWCRTGRTIVPRGWSRLTLAGRRQAPGRTTS